MDDPNPELIEDTNILVTTEPMAIPGEDYTPQSGGVIIISLIGISREENIICEPDLMFNLLAESEFGSEISSNPRYDITKHEVVLNIKNASRIPYLLKIKELKEIKNNNNLGNWPIESHSPVCFGCHVSEYKVVNMCYHNNEESLKVFRHHGVLPMSVTCPKCNAECHFQKDRERHIWRCDRLISKSKQKKQKCNFIVTDLKGTLLQKSLLKPWQILLFINAWIRKHFSVSFIKDNLELANNSICNWRSFCSEVTQFWFDSQKPIGGENIIVEIDETLIIENVDEDNCRIKVWLFAGIERESKKCFVVPREEKIEIKTKQQNQDSSIFIPLINRYIAKNSILYSDKWKDSSFNEEGYFHTTINQGRSFVDSQNSAIHVQCIKRLWRDIKEWICGPGFRRKYIKEYISRYLFLRQCKRGEELHNFLVEVARLYKPQSEEERPASRYQKAFRKKPDENSYSEEDLVSEADSEEDYLEKVFGLG